MNKSLKTIIVNWIRNINLCTQIGFLLVAGAIILAIIGALLLDRYKESRNDMPLKAKRSILLGIVWYGTVFGMTELGIAFVLLS